MAEKEKDSLGEKSQSPMRPLIDYAIAMIQAKNAGDSALLRKTYDAYQDARAQWAKAGWKPPRNRWNDPTYDRTRPDWID